MLGRLQTQPRRPVGEILEEYYGGFGRAKDAVRKYFQHWEAVSDAMTDASIAEAVASHGNPNPTFGFLVYAHTIFTPGVMSKGRALLAKAQVAAKGDPIAEERVAFLERGLRRAECASCLSRLQRESERFHLSGRGEETRLLPAKRRHKRPGQRIVGVLV